MSIFRNRDTVGQIPNISGQKINKIVSGSWTLLGTGASTTFDLTIPEAVNIERSILFLQLSEGGSASPRLESNWYLLNNTTVRLTRTNAQNGYAYVQYYIMEFKSGVKVQQGSLTFSAATGTATINSVNLRKSFVINNGNAVNSSDPGVYTTRMSLQNATTVLVEKYDASNSVQVRFQVVEIT